MVFNLLKSIKVFFVLIIFFLVFSFLLVFLAGGIVNEVGLYKLLPQIPLLLKVIIILTILTFFLVGIQTLGCSFLSFKKFSLNWMIHITAGLMILFSSLFIFLPVYQFRMYPGNIVYKKGIVIEIDNVKVDTKMMSVIADIVIRSQGKNYAGEVSYNKPFVSKCGILWIVGIDSRGIVFKYQPFSVLPFLTFFISLLFLFFLSIKVLKVLI